MDNITVEAPGKILLTGGYLILEKNEGISITTPCVFRTSIKISQNTENLLLFNVHSKFLMQPSKYSFSQNSGQYQKLDIGKDNILILNSLRSIFEKLKQINRRFTNKTFDIELEGEKEFYSFSDIVDINIKTGLGSSSSLCVSLVTALYCYFFSENLKTVDIDNHRMLKEMIEYSYLTLPSSKGSGFDIFTSLYGPIIFHGEAREIEKLDIKRVCYIHLFHNRNCTDTRKSIEVFRKWRERNSGSEVWREYVRITKEVNLLLVEFLKNNSFRKDDLIQLNLDLLKTLLELSKSIELEILPQTIYDYLMLLLNNKNIVFASVPGSGGYDAFYCISLENIIDVCESESFDRYTFDIRDIKQMRIIN